MQQGNGKDKKIGAKFTITIMSRKHSDNKMDCNELIQNEEKPLMWTIYNTVNLTFVNYDIETRAFNLSYLHNHALHPLGDDHIHYGLIIEKTLG
jgi:hypothetical protein